LKEENPKPQLNRRYLPQDLKGCFSNHRVHTNIFPPSSRTRKIRETSIQTIHLGGSSSILFLVLTLLCVLGFILFTQKALVGAINLRDSESSEINRVGASATPAIECFGEE
jgi:hypothetical protein